MTMKALLQLRWLIIDEIRMVSARLLADIDSKLRSYVRSVDPFARNSKKVLRPFAGVNVLFSGDCWQLPPSDGGFLGDIPHEFIENSRNMILLRLLLATVRACFGAVQKWECKV